MAKFGLISSEWPIISSRSYQCCQILMTAYKYSSPIGWDLRVSFTTCITMWSRSEPKTCDSLHLCAVRTGSKNTRGNNQICNASAVWMQPLSLSASVFASLSIPFSFSPPFSAPSPLPPLPAPGSLYLYPFQSEGSQSVSDLSSLIPTFKPAALKSLFDITRELSFSPLYLSADEDPPKSHLALLGKHFPLLSPR